MNTQYFRNISNFFVAGINYKKSDASTRGQFAINLDQYRAILEKSAAQGLNEVFKEVAYVKNGIEAIGHVYSVGAGLDSQILGDYEIVGQLKTAVKFSKEQGFVGSFTERLVNSVLQSSKLIKNNTELS